MTDDKPQFDDEKETVTITRRTYEHYKEIEANNVHIKSLIADGQKFDAVLAGDLVRVIATGMFAFIENTGAKNYVEIKMNHPEHGIVVMTMQKWEGRTPHEMRLEAEAERDQLKMIAALVDESKRQEAVDTINSYTKRMKFEVDRAAIFGVACEKIRAGDGDPVEVATEAIREALTLGREGIQKLAEEENEAVGPDGAEAPEEENG